MDGWIKIHRSLLNWEWWDDHNVMRVWLYLLLSVNHENRKWKGLTIERGQMVCSYSSISEATGLSIQQIRTIYQKLQSTNEINIKTNKHFTVLTVCKYDIYQIKDNDTNTPNNNQITINQQSNNNKQEYKNIRNNISTSNEVDNKGKSKKSFVPDLSFVNKAVLPAFEAFIEMRQSLSSDKRLKTQKGVELAYGRLQKVSNHDVKLAIELCELAIVNNWRSFYPEKGDAAPTTTEIPTFNA